MLSINVTPVAAVLAVFAGPAVTATNSCLQVEARSMVRGEDWDTAALSCAGATVVSQIVFARCGPHPTFHSRIRACMESCDMHGSHSVLKLRRPSRGTTAGISRIVPFTCALSTGVLPCFLSLSHKRSV